MKCIVVTGGVLSGIGKWISGASIGAILKAYGHNIFMQKFDGYLNVDAGTINPYKHGEVFVMDDGTETDLDLGHYERFIDINLDSYSCYTAGRLYEEILSKERCGHYLGQDVQIIPHLTDLIKQKVLDGFEHSNADISIVEIGWTVGDMENEVLVEAMRQLRQEHGPENVVFVHLTYLPYLAATKELKTKPTQNSVKDLRSRWITPDFLITRADTSLDDEIIKKIAFFCGVEENHVIPAPTVDTIYQIPLDYASRDVGRLILDQMKVQEKSSSLDGRKILYKNIQASTHEIHIAMVGKYVELEDAYYSLNEWLKVAWFHLQKKVVLHFIPAEKVEKDISLLSWMDGICIPGGFGDRGVEWMVAACRYARENKIPYLWICLGSHIMAIEFARYVLGIADANSEEFAPEGKENVVHVMEAQKWLTKKWWTMRLGSYPCTIALDSHAYGVYKSTNIYERHRHRYEFNNIYREQMKDAWFIVSGTSPDWLLAEIVEVKTHPFMIGVQFHPELISRPLRPHPLFVSFIRTCFA